MKYQTTEEFYDKVREVASLAVKNRRTFWKEFERWECDHDFVLKQRTIANGTVQAIRQCSICGRVPMQPSKRPPYWRRLPVVDAEFAKDTKEFLSKEANWVLARIEKEEAQEFTERNEDWWRIYNEYLSTEQWQDIRSKVLKRDVICQQCFENEASEVHHINYKSVFNERLFDLVGLCSPCHEETTKLNRSRRGRAGIDIAKEWMRSNGRQSRKKESSWDFGTL